MTVMAHICVIYHVIHHVIYIHDPYLVPYMTACMINTIYDDTTCYTICNQSYPVTCNLLIFIDLFII